MTTHVKRASLSEWAIEDPGTGAALPNDQSGTVEITTTAAGETNTLAAPVRAGVILTLNCAQTVAAGTDTRVITVAGGYDETGTTLLTLDTEGGFAVLQSMKSAVSTYAWRITAYDNVTGPVPIQDSSATVTATTGGGTTGLIPRGVKNITVSSDSANKQISLPAAAVGDEIWITVGATGCELISAVAAHKVNNVVVGATNEAALVATSTYQCRYVAANTWIMMGWTNLGSDEAAVVPDAL